MCFFCALRHLLTVYTFDSALGVVGARISSLEVRRDRTCVGFSSSSFSVSRFLRTITQT